VKEVVNLVKFPQAF